MMMILGCPYLKLVGELSTTLNLDTFTNFHNKFPYQRLGDIASQSKNAIS